MNYVFPNDVRAVYVATECGHLEKSVAKREKTRDKLENYMALSAKSGSRPMTRPKHSPQTAVDAIDYFTEKLRRRNEKVRKAPLSLTHT
jgi:hypothetical protein